LLTERMLSAFKSLLTNAMDAQKNKELEEAVQGIRDLSAARQELEDASNGGVG
jgi:hypothetical protein